MTFWNFIKISIGFDIACFVAIVFLMVKLRKTNIKVQKLQDLLESQNKHLILAIKNPLQAKRQLKKIQ